MDCVIRYKNMMLIAKMKFEEFILKLVYTDLRSQTTMVPPSNILDPSLTVAEATPWPLGVVRPPLMTNNEGGPTTPKFFFF
jgi:hypothetical protein